MSGSESTIARGYLPFTIGYLARERCTNMPAMKPAASKMITPNPPNRIRPNVEVPPLLVDVEAVAGAPVLPVGFAESAAAPPDLLAPYLASNCAPLAKLMAHWPSVVDS